MRRSDYRNALKFRLAALDRAIALARLHYRFASNAEKVVCVGELEDLAWRREQCLERLRRLEQERQEGAGGLELRSWLGSLRDALEDWVTGVEKSYGAGSLADNGRRHSVSHDPGHPLSR